MEVGQIAITVSDVDEALGFYRDILGLQFLFQAGPNLAFLSTGNLRLMLSTPQGEGEVGANSILYFKTVNIEQRYADLLEAGACAERAPVMVAAMSDHDLWLAFVRDTDQNLVGLMEEKAKSNTAPDSLPA